MLPRKPSPYGLTGHLHFIWHRQLTDIIHRQWSIIIIITNLITQASYCTWQKFKYSLKYNIGPVTSHKDLNLFEKLRLSSTPGSRNNMCRLKYYITKQPLQRLVILHSPSCSGFCFCTTIRRKIKEISTINVVD